MKYLNNHLRSTAARCIPSRAVAIAMLLGPAVGALVAFGTVAAEDPKDGKDANVVTIDNFSFGPAELDVAVGTTVKFVNHDDIPHSVVDNNKAFRSKALDTDDSYSYTFASAGTFSYFCGLPPKMVGKIVVK